MAFSFSLSSDPSIMPTPYDLVELNKTTRSVTFGWKVHNSTLLDHPLTPWCYGLFIHHLPSACMCSEDYCTWSVCVCVCVSVCYHYSSTPGYKVSKQWYQRPQCCVHMDIKKAISIIILCSKVMAWNMSGKAKFQLTVNCFCALPRSMKHGNHLMEN